METEIQNRVPLSTLVTLPEWEYLTNKQRVFLAKYISDGYNLTAAARVAYPKCETPNIIGHQVLSRPRVRKVLSIHFKRSTLDDLMDDLRQVIKRVRRRGTDMYNLLPALTRIADAFEQYIAKDTVHAN